MRRRPALARPPLAAACLGGAAALAAVTATSAASSAAAPPTADGIRWQPAWDAAFADAAGRDCPVFLAVNMDGERANDRMAAEMYFEEPIVALSERVACVVASRFEHAPEGRDCPRFEGLECAQHQAVDRRARADVLQAGPGGEVVAPQHVFLRPDGSVILSVPYQLRPEELAWCFVTAIRAMNEDAGVSMPADARAPRRLIMDGVAGGGAAVPPLTEDELEETLAAIQAGLTGRERLEQVQRLIATDHEDAIEFVAKELQGFNTRGGRRSGERAMRARRELVQRVGAISPPSYWEAVEPLLDDGDAGTHLAAAVALEQLGATDSLRALTRRLGREDDEAVQAALLRALGTCGAGNSSARKKLSAAAGAGDRARLQANALLALGSHFRDRRAREDLQEALEEGGVRARRAAALGIAFARAAPLAEALAAALEAEEDAGARRTMERARAVLQGANLAVIGPEVQEVCGDRTWRERFFGPSP